MTVAGKCVLLLWDVDHTLIENSGVSEATYAQAFAKLTGVAPTVQPGTGGRTDLEIMRNLFTANGIDLADVRDEQLEKALMDSGQELAPDLLAYGYVLPGVSDVLRWLNRNSTVVQSVLTGNIRSNAENKLALLEDSAVYLDLETGGYGSDDIVRSRLVGVAQAKAGRKYETVFDSRSTVLIGDTERDVAAARDGGAKVIAVATGVTSEAELRRAGADAVLSDLTDSEGLRQALAALTGEELGAVG